MSYSQNECTLRGGLGMLKNKQERTRGEEEGGGGGGRGGRRKGGGGVKTRES